LTFVFPASLPKDDPVTLWSLQQQLLSAAESRFGQRDTSKQIYQPIFRDDGPILINTPNLDGAFAALSTNAAAGYWPTTVFELAHETVHLLNPTVGYTNWLEEGVAVAFSIEMSAQLTQHPQTPSDGSNYSIAFRRLQSLPVHYHDAARIIRSECALGSVTVDILKRLFPHSELATLEMLADTCVPR
jgi:hypothetical protein